MNFIGCLGIRRFKINKYANEAEGSGWRELHDIEELHDVVNIPTCRGHNMITVWTIIDANFLAKRNPLIDISSVN